MSDSTKTVSPLRQRNIEDMTTRKLKPGTKYAYIFDILSNQAIIWGDHHTATSEDLRLYQLHLINYGIATGNLNAQLSGLRFLPS